MPNKEFISLENLSIFKEEADSSFATKTDLTSKQNTLISGSNIKTINNTSILGAGDITIETIPHISITTSASSGTLTAAQLALLNLPSADAVIEIVEDVEEGEEPIIDVYRVYSRTSVSVFAINMNPQYPKKFGVNRTSGVWGITAVTLGVTEARVQEMIDASVNDAIKGEY